MKGTRQPVQSTTDPTLWLKRNNQRVVRKKFSLKQRINNFFYKDIASNGKSPTFANRKSSVKSKYFIPTILAFLIFIVVMISGVTLYFTFKNTDYRMNETQFVDKSILGIHIQEYLHNHLFFQIDTDDFEQYLKDKNPLIQRVHINKSFFHGMILDVKEFKPLAVLIFKDDFDGYSDKVYYTDDAIMIDYFPTATEPIALQYEGKKHNEDFLDVYVRKSILTVEKLNNIGIQGNYTFDNFGNFSILTLGNTLIRLDLKEKYFSLDDQMKVLQNALVMNATSREFDLRFKYLVVKQ